MYPHPILLGIGIPVSVVFLTYSFLTADPTDAVSILAYSLSFYMLAAASIRVPRIIQWVKRLLKENKYIVRYRSDVRLRMNASLFSAFFYNSAYAVFQLCLGIYHGSVWFYAMAGYYLSLAAMRLLLVRHTKNYEAGEQLVREWKKYRLCGICLLFMNLSLSAIIFFITWQNRTFRHHEITTIAMAAYTFFSFTMAIIHVIQYRKYQSPVYSAAKIISLVSAMVSMLTLETAMLTVFGQESGENFRRFMLGSTGAVIVLCVQAMAIHMIVTAGKQRKKK